jgi:hypothetical protein
MILATLDVITRRALLEDNLPIHYYFEYLLHASTCLRELSFDTLKIVNTIELPVNDYGAVDLPDDFVDEVSVGYYGAGVLQPLPHQDWISPIRMHDPSTGQYVKPQIPFNGVVPTDVNNVNSGNDLFLGGLGIFWFWNVSDFGEPTGRFFGSTGGTQIGYKVIKERRQIQMSYGYERKSIVLQYISDGQSIDNASQIDTQAIQTIRAWQEWKHSPNANNEYSPEAMAFWNRKKTLRSRLSGLTLVDVKNALRSGYTGAVKN